LKTRLENIVLKASYIKLKAQFLIHDGIINKAWTINFYRNNDTKDYPQQNKFVIVDIIQNE